MNSYDSTNLVKALDEIAGSMPDASEIKDALGDLYAATTDNGNALDAIGEQLTQISNTLARTLGREQTRFIEVTFAGRGVVRSIAVSQILMVRPAHVGLLSEIVLTNGQEFALQESYEEVLTMINAGSYVPPF